MEEVAIKEILRDIPLFACLKPIQLDSLYKHSKIKEFSEGTAIVRKGDLGTTFYLILDGHVQVKDGDLVLEELGLRQYFGEMSLIEEAPRMADVIATADTKCLLIPQNSFVAMVKIDSELCFKILKEFSRRLRERSRKLHELTRLHEVR